jgi:dolichol kinase
MLRIGHEHSKKDCIIKLIKVITVHRIHQILFIQMCGSIIFFYSTMMHHFIANAGTGRASKEFSVWGNFWMKDSNNLCA